MPINSIGITHEAADAIATVISAKALGHFKANTVAAQLVARDWENEIATRGGAVKVFKRGALVANDKIEHTEVTLQQPAETAVTVTLDKHKEVSFLVEDPVRFFASTDLVEGHIEDAMKVLAEQVDRDILALYTGLSQTINAVGGLSEETFRNAARFLDTAKAPLSDRFALLAPRALYEARGIEEYVNSAYNRLWEGQRSAIALAADHRYMGFDVYLNQMVPTVGGQLKNLFAHRYALVLVTRPMPPAPAGLGVIQKTMSEDGFGLRVTMSYAPSHLGVQVTVDCLYGVAELHDVFGVVVSTAA